MVLVLYSKVLNRETEKETERQRERETERETEKKGGEGGETDRQKPISTDRE